MKYKCSAYAGIVNTTIVIVSNGICMHVELAVALQLCICSEIDLNIEGSYLQAVLTLGLLKVSVR